MVKNPGVRVKKNLDEISIRIWFSFHNSYSPITTFIFVPFCLNITYGSEY